MKRTSADQPPHYAEALLQSLGADPSFVDDVLGDLAEEYRDRVDRAGPRSARWWYYRQAVRTAPHLVRDWRRRLGSRAAARLAASMVAAFLVLFVVDRELSMHIIPWLTYHTTGIGLWAEINHWLTTGDMFPWVLVYYVCLRTIPPACAGYVMRFTAKRESLMHSALFAVALFAWISSSMVMHASTVSGFVQAELLMTMPYALSCLVGGLLAVRARSRSLVSAVSRSGLV